MGLNICHLTTPCLIVPIVSSYKKAIIICFYPSVIAFMNFFAMIIARRASIQGDSLTADRLTNGQMDRLNDRQTDRQTDRQAGKQIER